MYIVTNSIIPQDLSHELNDPLPHDEDILVVVLGRGRIGMAERVFRLAAEEVRLRRAAERIHAHAPTPEAGPLSQRQHDVHGVQVPGQRRDLAQQLRRKILLV